MEWQGFARITDQEFEQFKNLIHELAGIHFPPTKKMLVAGRLNKRLRHYGLASYGEYYHLVKEDTEGHERQMMVDLLTTNETYFFREPDHFTYLEHKILPNWRGTHSFRAWSAACSSGEEAYSIAMVLMEKLQGRSSWEVLGSDISKRMLEAAAKGHYDQQTAKIMPQHYLHTYCLKGVRAQAGTFLVDKKIRDRVQFKYLNLNQELPPLLGLFDVVFLRNILIYFNLDTKQRIVRKILKALRPGGFCFIGHAESLMGMSDPEIREQVELVAPTIYRKC